MLGLIGCLKFTTSRSLEQLAKLCLSAKSPFTVNELRNLKSIMSDLQADDSSISAVQSLFKLQDRLPPLECLWQLQSKNFIQFTTYIYFHSDSTLCLGERFEELIWCQDDAVREQCAETVAGLLTVLVNLGTHSPRDVRCSGEQLLSTVFNKFVCRLLREPETIEEPVPFLPQLMNNVNIVKSRRRVFSLNLLRDLVRYAPDTVTLEETIQQQSRRKVGESTVQQVFIELLSKLGEDDVVNELSSIVSSEEEFNWEMFVTTISVLVSSSPLGADTIKKVVDKWLTQACSAKETQLLAAALLSARQGCLDNPDKFGPYSSWFGGLQVRTLPAFTFLFNLLAQIVPYEPVLYLKIHVNKVPSAPANCHRVVSDYAVLAKTRLADLNQTTDFVGLFGEYTTSEQEGREADVVKVLEYFKLNNEIMKIVLEASVFRRQFYEKVFLVELLKDCPDQNRANFIEKLYSKGKIPHGMYSKWKH